MERGSSKKSSQVHLNEFYRVSFKRAPRLCFSNMKRKTKIVLAERSSSSYAVILLSKVVSKFNFVHFLGKKSVRN
jgi:hypothetical protein